MAPRIGEYVEQVEEAMKTCIQRLGYSKVKEQQKEAS